MGTLWDHAAGLQKWLVPGREPCSRQEAETWIGTLCRVKLDIYLVGYGGEGGEGKKGREKERERNKGKGKKLGQTKAASLRGRWKRKELRLEAEDQLASADKEGASVACLLKGQDRSLQWGYCIVSNNTCATSQTWVQILRIQIKVGNRSMNVSNPSMQYGKMETEKSKGAQRTIGLT